MDAVACNTVAEKTRWGNGAEGDGTEKWKEVGDLAIQSVNGQSVQSRELGHWLVSSGDSGCPCASWQPVSPICGA